MAAERPDHETGGEDPGADEGEVAESTIAMGAPTFDLEGVPSPISDAPPAMPAPHTAPVGFKPAAAPAAVPQLGRVKAPSTPGVPTPLGGIVPTPAPGGAGAVPGGGARPRLRAQTVIGIAPAPPGAPRPVSVRQVAKAPAPTPGPSPKEIPVEAPTPAPAADAFGLDADVAAAARAAAFKPGPRASAAARDRRLPSLDSTPPKADGETQTRAVPRDQLPPSSGPSDRARNELPSVHTYDQDEETKLRESDAHVHDARVVQDDASGDDATIAAPPRSNQALQHFNPAFAQTLASEGAAPRPSSPSFSNLPPQQVPQQHGGLVVTPQPFQAPWPGHAPQQGHAPQGHAPQAYPQHYAPPQHAQHPQHPQQAHPGQMPMQPHPHHPVGAPPSYRAPTIPGAQQAYPQPQQGAPKLSGQILLLAVVGVICVSVFVFGVVLFVTK